jgi:hypothetical protein
MINAGQPQTYRLAFINELSGQGFSVSWVRLLQLLEKSLGTVTLHALGGESGYESIENRGLGHEGIVSLGRRMCRQQDYRHFTPDRAAAKLVATQRPAHPRTAVPSPLSLAALASSRWSHCCRRPHAAQRHEREVFDRAIQNGDSVENILGEGWGSGMRDERGGWLRSTEELG